MKDLSDTDIDDIGRDIAMLLDELTRVGEVYLQNAVRKSRLEFTGELLDSIRGQLRSDITNWSGEISLFFNDYWRYKDMKFYTYNDSFINVDAIRKFVKKVGVDKFAWVPGYNEKGRISEEKAIDRITRAIVFYRRKVPRVVNARDRRLYAKTKGAYQYLVRKRVMELTGVKTLKVLVRELEI